MNIKKKKAFTLAEVLITIAVVGIVAAFIIPIIKNRAFEKEAVSKAKKTYALISSAVTRWQTDGNCLDNAELCPEISPKVWPGGVYPHNAGAIARGITKYLPVIKSYYSPSDAIGKTIEFIPEKSYTLAGGTYNSAVYVSHTMDRAQSQYSYANYFLLKNGVVIEIFGCWWTYDIMMDINGIKPPNRKGKDQFTMSLYSAGKKGLSPYMTHGYYPSTKLIQGECNNNVAANNNCNPDDGRSPLAYVLTHDKLPDLRKLGYPANP